MKHPLATDPEIFQP